MSDSTEIKFCNIVKQRSSENYNSFMMLHKNGLYGNCISILRQELDSYLRIMYLLESDKKELFISQTLAGLKWSYIKNGRKYNITDAIILNNIFDIQGWEKRVYDLGCAFIHLSNFHNYLLVNPFLSLSENDKKSILQFIKDYHGIELQELNINTIIPVLPLVMEKISKNLQCAVESILSPTNNS